jgi:hypothetical protein
MSARRSKHWRRIDSRNATPIRGCASKSAARAACSNLSVEQARVQTTVVA